MPKKTEVSGRDYATARLRYSIIGSLLASPPRYGELGKEIEALSRRRWLKPGTDEEVYFGASTIERWFYTALHHDDDPLAFLGRKLRSDRGTHPSIEPAWGLILVDQYRQHPSWSYQLHWDNLVAQIQSSSRACTPPSYSTVRRFMKEKGLIKRKRKGRGDTSGSLAAEKRFETHEIRSYERPYAHQLWHLDYHCGSLKVLLPDGQWVYPYILGILDDHTRLCVHAQWYLTQTAENLVHALSQALQKYGCPRAIMSDNGSAMIAAETVHGLERLGIVHEKTLPYSPYQNGKQEVFWAQIEGRLLAMLEGCRDLKLSHLNETTQVWINSNYHCKEHSETGQSPKARYLEAKDLSRPAPSDQKLREVFTVQAKRRQRQSDGTISLEGVRLEIPSSYRHLPDICIRYASWDLSHVYLCDERSDQLLCRIYPQDKHKNADGKRKRQAGLLDQQPTDEAFGHSGKMAPLLQQMMDQHKASGRPAAYLPKDELPKDELHSEGGGADEQ